jgi:hypothetical protein|tara:strand:+ start:559 stop:660 length:102 start_codon:yes stop_codon:yes gene_type:complete
MDNETMLYYGMIMIMGALIFIGLMEMISDIATR